ncbi:phosphoribosyltransferase family protein [Pistricoccus aurantiacus]|uniref:phosphoribosyltransferase family protein n=1 Tax=Pistricoccus aurantiacus TaxID=1883414 RepID=UPI0036438760
MNFKSYAELSSDILNSINKVQHEGYDLIVAIPRSGVIPAYMLSLSLNIDCAMFNEFLANARLAKGSVRRTRKQIRNAWDAKKVLIVDDSVDTGNSIAKVLEQIPEDCPCEITTLAVYGNVIGLSKADICLKYLASPRIFQWNMWHCGALRRACIVLDDVIFDCQNESCDKEQVGLASVDKFKPLVLPSYKIHSLITRQPERYREAIESWLSLHGISYDNLIMANADGDTARDSQDYRNLKAEYYKQNPELNFFVENDFDHAVYIAKATGKSVFCTQINDTIKPPVEAVIKYGKANFFRTNFVRMKKLIKNHSLRSESN